MSKQNGSVKVSTPFWTAFKATLGVGLGLTALSLLGLVAMVGLVLLGAL